MGVRFFERGGMKFAIMELLKDRPRHGYDIIRAMEEHSQGMYSPSAGAIYPILQALEDQGLLVSATEGDRRVYSVTRAGLIFLEAHKEEAQSHRDRWTARLNTNGGHSDRWKALVDARALVERITEVVYFAGNDPAKCAEIRRVLEDTAEKVEQIAKR
jgi:DNA-binding PadR family transcriptional regulator